LTRRPGKKKGKGKEPKLGQTEKRGTIVLSPEGERTVGLFHRKGKKGRKSLCGEK